jgi:outer membrane protein assembly factor BamD (BamD/ComL family)
MGKYRGAFALYKSYLKEHPLSPHTPLVQKRLYDMGIYTMNAGSEGFLGILDYADEGIEMLEYLVDVFPYGDRADDALKQMSDYELTDRRPHSAIEHLKELLQFYPGSEWVLEARLDLARAYRALNRGAEYDSDVLMRSVAEYRAYIEIVSSDPARKIEYADRLAAAESERDGVIELLAEKSMAKADYYLRTGRTEAAKNQLLNTVRRFPGTVASDSARRQLGLDAAEAIEPTAPGPADARPLEGTR